MKQTHQDQKPSQSQSQSKPNKLSLSSPKTNAAPKSKQPNEPPTPNGKTGPNADHAASASRTKPKRAFLPKSPIQTPAGSSTVIKRSDQQDMANTSKHRVTGESARDEKLGLIKKLEMQVMILREELDKVNGRNIELVSRNICLTQQLSSALAKIDSFQSSPKKQADPIEEQQTPNFKALQLLIANKLEQPRSVKREPIEETRVEKTTTNAVAHAKIPEPATSSRGPPPPPPPPPRVIPARKASTVEELYHSLSKRAATQSSPINGNFNTSTAHNSIVGEIQNRSSHLLAIRSDIETKGEFINGLIEKVLAASFADIEDVANFVDWLDRELLCLADERAVLKHFKWPEKKADAMREAAIEYRSLKHLEKEVSSYKDDSTTPYGIALKKMANLLDKSEKSIQRITTLRNSVMRSYQDHNVPIEWLLDSGLVCKIKKGSRQLAKKYIDRLMMELQSNRHSERESTQETLLLQGVHFAYKAQQIAGGLDSETLCAFEEMRRWVPSQELLMAGVPSS